ncbi:DNA-binding response regulator [Bremerella cremea]|uniref:DNA-binding response regulator n=1 Tax=Blastopirellula marina TaxID=124 RepID=A0A2S8FYI2_9BACT|nr:MULTISPECIES: response regulator transcription factor [Pirellulaceae]PQO37242.1 DNA-binding response regulator [Blastopirellula marina]RCS49629.1 DNA-binding response regulator [Bremerella cremea]
MKSNADTHILVVEDEEHLAIGIRYNLEAEGYQVSVAEDGRAALRIVDDNTGHIDLVILDLMLPGMSGYAVCETLRSNGEDMPILILSARTLSEDRTRGFDVGADQYMMKPFDLDEFLSRVKNLLALRRRRQPQKDPEAELIHQYSFGDVEIDFDSFQAFVGGKPIRLTQLESKLLHYFVTHPQRIIPKQELLREVWEMPANVSTRAPDQFIARLRKMFEKDKSKPKYFITIRDAGYQFIPNGDEEEKDSLDVEPQDDGST